MHQKDYYVYILTNPGHSVLYVGVTNDLFRRISEHREGKIPGFTQRYQVKHLIYYEDTSDVHSALEREKQIKKWSRMKKEILIASMNPQWIDLFERINAD